MENEKKLGQNPAFPTKPRSVVIGHESSSYIDVDGFAKTESHNVFGEQVFDGMSTRLYLAGMAMQGILANRNTCADVKTIIEDSLNAADELLRQENL